MRLFCPPDLCCGQTDLEATQRESQWRATADVGRVKGRGHACRVPWWNSWIAPTETCVHILHAVRWDCTLTHTPTHTHTCDCSSLAWLFSPVSLQGCRKGQSEKQNETSPPHAMKTEGSVNQSVNDAGALRCVPGSNYGSAGKRIKVRAHPGVPLVGLMLLATLPFGASIKQSVPRVKLSHRGKNLKYCWFWLVWLDIYIDFDHSVFLQYVPEKQN